MNPSHKLWQIHFRQWRIYDLERLIHLRFMNTTTINMNTPHISLFYLPYSLLSVTYSCFLGESHLLLNEYGPFLTQSAHFIMNPPLLSGKKVGYLFSTSQISAKSVLFGPYSLADVAYSSIFLEFAMTQNECASVENESATQFLRFPHFSLLI